MIVDDDEAILDVLGQYMKIIGLDAVGASSGEEALSLFQKDHFDIVVSDIKMANMDGLTLLGEVKRIDPEILFSSLQAIPPSKQSWRP